MTNEVEKKMKLKTSIVAANMVAILKIFILTLFSFGFKKY